MKEENILHSIEEKTKQQIALAFASEIRACYLFDEKIIFTSLLFLLFCCCCCCFCCCCCCCCFFFLVERLPKLKRLRSFFFSSFQQPSSQDMDQLFSLARSWCALFSLYKYSICAILLLLLFASASSPHPVDDGSGNGESASA